MKKYFAYPFDQEIKEKLSAYYNNPELEQHTKQQIKTGIKLQRIKAVVDFLISDNVLDIGCSRGFLLQEISSYIKKGIGLDISENIIVENNKQIKLPNITFESYDGVNIPHNNEFTKITMLDILEHAFEPDSLMSHVYRSLKPDGELILEVPFTGWLSELFVKKYHQGHLRYYDPKYLQNYLEKLGFLVETIKTYNSIPFASLLLRIKIIWRILDFIINLIPARFFPYYGEVIVIAKKNVSAKHE